LVFVADLVLRLFTRDHLALVEPWFLDAETNRWLGGPDWPRLMLDLADRPLGEFRGALQTGRYRWLAWASDRPVGYIDCGSYDRWTTWEGGPRGRGVIATIGVPSGAIAFVVDPDFRRRGYCTAMIGLLFKLAELAHIELLAAGVEPDNVGLSSRTTERRLSGFGPQPGLRGSRLFRVEETASTS
jgi:RimJ/RimL family protein N-acetyltransferase